MSAMVMFSQHRCEQYIAEVERLKIKLLLMRGDLMKRFFRKLWWHFQPHYVIIGKHTQEVIGCCTGDEGKALAMEQEPGCTLKRVSRHSCPNCKEAETTKQQNFETII